MRVYYRLSETYRILMLAYICFNKYRSFVSEKMPISICFRQLVSSNDSKLSLAHSTFRWFFTFVRRHYGPLKNVSRYSSPTECRVPP